MTPLTPEEVRAELERLKRNPDKLDPEKLAEVNAKTSDLLTILLKAVAKALHKDKDSLAQPAVFRLSL